MPGVNFFQSNFAPKERAYGAPAYQRAPPSGLPQGGIASLTFFDG
jgi:hypothetical protein